MTPSPSRIDSLACFGLTTADARSAADFYESAFGCRLIATTRLTGSDVERTMGAAGAADQITLGLGDEIIQLTQFKSSGAPYPRDASSSDLIFQHFAIVVDDMKGAMERLSAIGGWTAISTNGPERLPASAGAVTAFKFRDPEGHPLELLAFPDSPQHQRPAGSAHGNCLGIDHSAISVSDSAASIDFYEKLGLRVVARTVNTGPEQQRLDAVAGAHVEVTALAPDQPTPHLELLCYRGMAARPASPGRIKDIAGAHLIFDARGGAGGVEAPGRAIPVHDPDGHILLIIR